MMPEINSRGVRNFLKVKAMPCQRRLRISFYTVRIAPRGPSLHHPGNTKERDEENGSKYPRNTTSIHV